MGGAQLTGLQSLARGDQHWSASSAAVLPLDARHQLLLRVIVGDGRLPLRSLVAAAWGSVGEKHRQGWVSLSNSRFLWQPQWSLSGSS